MGLLLVFTRHPSGLSRDQSLLTTVECQVQAGGSSGGWPTSATGKYNSQEEHSFSALGCPLFACFSQTWDLARKANLSLMGSGSCDRDGPHFSQKTREMGHPRVLTFRWLRIADRCGPTTRLRGKLTKRRGELGEAAFLAAAASSHSYDLNSRQCAVRRSPAWPAGGARRGREPPGHAGGRRPAPRLRDGRSG